MSRRSQLALVLLCAFAFGVIAAWAKGQGTDGRSEVSQLRGVIGNLSTPWLLVAFVAGTQATRLRTGALLGLLATMTALLGFYLLTSFVVDLGGHGPIDDLRRELMANRVYLEGALITGPLFGALGTWWHRTRSLGASVLAGALMMAEPLVLAAIGALFSGGVLQDAQLPLIVRIVPGWGLRGGESPIRIGVLGAEFCLGLALVVVGVLRWRERSREVLVEAPEPRNA